MRVNSNQPTPVFIWIAFVTVGGLVASLGVGMVVSRLVWLSTTETVEGKVVFVKPYTYEQRRRDPGMVGGTAKTTKKAHQVRVSYVVAGKQHEIESSLGSAPRHPISVAYNTSDPSDARILGNHWSLPTFFFLIGSAFVAIAILGYRYEQKRKHLYVSAR